MIRFLGAKIVEGALDPVEITIGLAP